MNIVATNIRFSKDDYEEIKKLAFFSRTSVASIIRKSVYFYRESLISKSDRKKLFDKIVNSSVKLKTSTVDLVKAGRKFE